MIGFTKDFSRVGRRGAKFLLAEDLLAQIPTVEFAQKQDDFFEFVSLLFIYFLEFGFQQILSLKMDHFL